jgi:RNA polymerase sigma-70 factor (ECF subfamily)
MPSADVSGCAEAFEREVAFIQRSLRHHGIQPSDIDDLTQEVLIVMWRRWSDYDQTRPLRPWLAGIVFKLAHRHRQRMKRERAHAVVEEPAPPPSLEEQVERQRQRALALRALGALPDRHRAVLVLCDMDGLILEDVARILDVPRSTAFSRLQRARATFAKAVRRLRTIEQAAGRTVPDAARLLAAEREEPAQGHERSIDRTRRILLSVPLEPPESSAPGGFRPWTLGAAVLVLAAAAIVLAPRLRPRATVASPAKAASVTRGLVGYWRFDETDGSVAADGSGHGNHCVLRRRTPEAAPSWAPGRVGGALQLEGDGWLECPRSASLALSSVELSVAAWVRLPGGRSGVQTVVARQQAADVRDDFFFGIFARTPALDELVINSRTWSTRVDTPLVGARGRWLHVAATQSHDGATTLFVDGKAVATRWAKHPQERLQGTKPILIGGGANGPEPQAVNQLFDGGLDELRVYERALGAEEIAALAAGPAP